MLGRRWIVAGMLGVVIGPGACITGRYLAPLAVAESTQQFNERARSSATLETLEYEHGWLESRALSRLTSHALSRTFLVEHRIEHAPWTPLRRAAMVRVTSWLWKESGDGGAAGSDAPIGELRTRIVLPYVVYGSFALTPGVVDDARAVTWKELKGSFSGIWKSHRAELELVDLELGRGALRMGKLHLDVDAKLGGAAGDEVEIVGFTSRVERIAGTPGTFERLEVSMAQRPSGALLGYELRMEAHGLQGKEGTLDEMVLDFTLENISPGLRSAFRSDSAPDASVLLTVLEKAVLDSPALTLRELRVKGEQQGTPVDVALAGRIAIDGERCSGSAAEIEALLDCVDADLELRVGEELAADIIRKPLGERGMQGMDARSLTEVWVQNGTFVRDGAYLEARLEMRGTNSVVVNGQSMDQAIRQFASLLERDEARAASRQAPSSQSTIDIVRRHAASNAELDEMRRQMGLK